MGLSIFSSTVKDGIMSKDKEYYNSLTKEEIDKIYEINLNNFLKKVNLSIADTVIINDKNIKKSSTTATHQKKNIKDRIILLKENTKNLAVIVETNDDPIIVASAKDEKNNTVAAICHGIIENIDTDIIHDMTEALMKATNAATFEMTFYIGPCPSKENYIIDKKTLTNNKIWEKALETKKNKTYLDLRYAIFNQLYLEIVDPNNIYFDSTDTVMSDKYFSNIGNKKGKHVSCVVFKDEEV